MSATHTPGPWSSGGHDGKRCELVASEWGTVAAVWPIGASDQETANARLIAAAPELLAMLEKLVPAPPDLGELDLGEEDNALLDEARALIAKAKGVK